VSSVPVLYCIALHTWIVIGELSHPFGSAQGDYHSPAHVSHPHLQFLPSF
jgi:hypothetical protein